MYISVGTALAVLFCLWIAYGVMPELNRVAKEREWSAPEREAARRRKKGEPDPHEERWKRLRQADIHTLSGEDLMVRMQLDENDRVWGTECRATPVKSAKKRWWEY